MQAAKIGMEYRYDLTGAGFQTAFAFLKRTGLGELPEGWIELENGVRASVQHYVTMDADTLDFETHDHHCDVQYLVEGREYIGCRSRDGLVEKISYDPKEDITFYAEPAASGRVLLEAGDYVVLTPGDAHKPRCAAGEAAPVKKIVVKVPV